MPDVAAQPRSATAETADGVDPADRLVKVLRGYGRVAVALSGGVDSAVVAQAAALACGPDAVAMTADSPSLAAGELDAARALAAQSGLRHIVLATREFEQPDYLRNPANRCYFCKTELYAQMAAEAARLGIDVLANGANLDDQGDHRPGMQAAAEARVRSPLVEAGLRKADVRAIARRWNLPVWDKPASPCLSSRIAYGVPVTPERVRRIDAAEQWLRERLGVRELRVRLDAHDGARIELPVEQIFRMLDAEVRRSALEHLQALGFRYVSVDLAGFRSGSLNAMLSPEDLVQLGV